MVSTYTYTLFYRNFDRDYVGRILVYILSYINVSTSHQAHVSYFVLSDLAKVKNLIEISASKSNINFLSLHSCRNFFSYALGTAHAKS